MAPFDLCTSVCILEPWATYSKQQIGHKFCVVCGGNLFVGDGVYPPQGGGGNRHLATVPPGVGGNRRPWGGGWTWGGEGMAVVLLPHLDRTLLVYCTGALTPLRPALSAPSSEVSPTHPKVGFFWPPSLPVQTSNLSVTAGVGIEEAITHHFGVPSWELVKVYPPVQRYSVERVAGIAKCIAGLGLDVKTVVRRYPPVVGFNTDTMQLAFAYVDSLGVDARHVVTWRPSLLGVKLQKMEDTVEYLEELGVDVLKVVRGHPIVFARSRETMKSTVAFLRDIGANVPMVVNGRPGVFGLSMVKLRRKVAYLQEAGVDVPRVVNRLPPVLGYSLEKMQGNMAYLQELGVNAPKTASRLPAVLGLRPDRIKGTVAYLRTLGLDVPKVVNAFPTLLGYSIEKNIQPKVDYLQYEMGRQLSEINTLPQYLSYSLEKRIRPRYTYLQHVDRNVDCSLSYMLAWGDAEFAERVAQSDLDDYLRWKSERFRTLAAE